MASGQMMTDRDVVAAVQPVPAWSSTISQAHEGLQVGAVEAVKGNPTTTVILRVDAPKPSQPKTWKNPT